MKGEARWQQLEQTADHGSSQFFLNGGLQGSFEPRRMHCCLQRWQLLVVVGVHRRRRRLIANFSRATLHDVEDRQKLNIKFLHTIPSAMQI